MSNLRVIYEPEGRAREYATLALNPWIGCEHGCAYCYGPATSRTSRRDFRIPRLRKDILANVEHDAKVLAGSAEPVLLSFLTDPYQPCDVTNGFTRHIIRILHRADIPVSILTKGGIRAVRDFDLLTKKDWFGVSLTLWDSLDSKFYEPGAALPADRIATLANAKRHGIRTWASLEPIISPEQTVAIITYAAQYIDRFFVGKLNHVKNTTNWIKAARDILNALEANKCDYYFKTDLMKYLPPGTPQSREKKREVSTS